MKLTVKKNTLGIILVVLFDIAFFAASLLTFAYFHHVKPRDFNITALATPTPVPTATPSPTPTATPTPTPVGVTPNPNATPTPTPSPTPSPEPTGLLGLKYRYKFTDGEIISDDDCYRSKNVAVEITRVEKVVNGRNLAYYVADIYIQDISSFATYVSETEDHKEWVVDMANNNNAIVATSGDYFAFKRRGLIIRNGQLYRESLSSSQDVCVLYYDGTVETFYAGEVDLDYIYSKMPYQAWSFGPKLLENGQPKESFNTTDYLMGAHPRCAFGYYEPGHYCFVLVDGRQSGYSDDGLTLIQLSQLMYELGCTDAYNLDGGMTAMMAYNGELISRPCAGGRPNCDILLIREPEE